MWIHRAAGQLTKHHQCAARRTANNDILIFRPATHAARFARSAAVVFMPAVPSDLFQRAVHMAIARNAAFVPPADFGGCLYVRPLLFGSSMQLALDRPDECTFCVYVQPTPAYYHGDGTIRALVAEDFDRAATRGTGNVKVGGNYAPVMPWWAEARKGGWDVLLHVDSQTQSCVDEFSTSAFIGIVAGAGLDANSELDGVQERTPTVVIGTSAAAVESITADSVARLAESFGWKVERRTVSRAPLTAYPSRGLAHQLLSA